RLRHRPAAVGTTRRQRHIDCFVNLRRWLAVSVSAVAPTNPAASRLGMGPGRTLRERRCLSLPGAANRVQLFLQSLVFAFQPLAGALRFLELSTQAIELSIEIAQGGSFLRRRRVAVLVTHAPVMPESPPAYKRDPLTSY